MKTLTQTLKNVGKAILMAVAISSLQIGDKVLAYNESTKGTYEVTDVRSHEKPIYELKLETSTKQLEVIETTSEHPFFVQKFGNKTPTPKAEGHEDLLSHWVGTKDLVILSIGVPVQAIIQNLRIMEIFIRVLLGVL